MCNFYSLTKNVEAIRRLFRIPHNRSLVFVAGYFFSNTHDDKAHESRLAPALTIKEVGRRCSPVPQMGSQ